MGILIKLGLCSLVKKWFGKGRAKKHRGSFAIEGSAYAIIAKCSGLSHVRNNVYANIEGKHFVLTKYGFEPAILHNERLLNEQLRRELEDVTAKNAVLTDKLKRKENLTNQLELRIASLRTQLRRQGQKIEE